MPRVVSVTNAFAAGVLSAGAYGRTDIAKYQSGLSCCHNYVVEPLGGIKRRAGTRFVCETKFSQFFSRVMPFQFSTSQSYMFEVGCQYLRIYRNSVPVGRTELVTNGTFDADISGWTTTGTVTWSSGNGAMRLQPSSTARQDVTVTANVPHRVVFRLAGINNSTGSPGGGTVEVLVGSTSGGGELLDTLTSNGVYAYIVTSPTVVLSFKVIASADAAYLDTVSIQPFSPFEVPTPYDHTQLFDIDTVQSADEQYWLHACVPTRKVQRYADTCWKFNCVQWRPVPSIEYGARPATEIQAGALSGVNVTFTAFNGPTFLAADAGREIRMVSGSCNAGSRAGIVSVTSSLAVVANICVPFLTTTVNCHGHWIISGSPLALADPSEFDSIGKTTASTLDKAGWRGTSFTTDTDCGKFAIINGGCFEITCVTSTTIAQAVVRGQASSGNGAEPGAWSLNEALWSCARGYARTGDFYGDRLYLDAIYRFCGSKSGDYENFSVGVLDDDAVLFAMNSKTINAIQALVGGQDLEIYTTGGEYIATGGTTDPITPSNVNVKNQTLHGAGGVPPIRAADGVTLFVTNSGKQLREFTVPADSITGKYSAPDLMLLAGLTESAAIVDMAYQREPTSILWVVLDDGRLASCAYRREENVVAWSTHSTCGSFESVACIPHPDGDRDQVWLIVRRLIGGAEKRYVEYLDDSPLIYDRRFTDAAMVFTCGAATTVFAGLNHLEGERVRVQADGRDLGYFTVALGQITLPVSAKAVEVGLPYTSEAITLQPEVSFGGQSIQPMAKRWSRLFLRTKDSCGMDWRTTGAYEPVEGMTNTTVADFTRPALSTWTDGRVGVRQEKALPSHVLMVGGVLDVGDA